MAEQLRPKAVLFDLYNTLIEIRTVEDDPIVWTQLALFLSYQGVEAESSRLHADFRQRIQTQQQQSAEAYPEIDMVAIFQGMLGDIGHANPELLSLPVTQLFRTLTMRHLELFPDTMPALQALHGTVALALVSDAQRAWLVPEMQRAGIGDSFAVRVISGDHGFRKPDPRLFTLALEQLGVQPAEAVFVGDSAFRDVCGAQQVGLRGCLVTRHAPFEAADSLCTPDLIFQTLIEFVRWIQGGEQTPAQGVATERGALR
jgi:putative hydrolase of the HAD superfamily